MEQQSPDSTTTRCMPSRPCNRWRTCKLCARRRQAKIADAVERLKINTGTLRWHILYPNIQTEQAIKKTRESWLKTAAPDGAIWTIEQSRQTGTMHCNIITPAETLHTPQDANYWQQLITGDVRNVGAYISKQSQMPRPKDYSGRLYGCAGRLWEILSKQELSPAVAAAAAQYAIDSDYMMRRAAELALSPSQRNRLKWAAQEELEKARQQKTHEEYREIASRWLPDLLEWKERNREKSTLEKAREFIKREGSI